MDMQYMRTLGCAAALVSGLVGPMGAAVAQDTSAGVMEPEAVEILEGMSAYLKAAKTFTFRSKGLREVVSPSGVKLLLARSSIFIVERPDRLHAMVHRDDGSRFRVWFDGEALAIMETGAGGHRYATIAAPDGVSTLDGMLDHLIDEYDFVLQLGDLLYEDIGASLGKGLLSAVYLGPSLVDGRKCHHLSLELSGIDAQLWVQDGDDPSPCRWAFNLTDEPGAPLFASSFDSWATNPTIDARHFAFEPPAGASEVDIKELLSAGLVFE